MISKFNSAAVSLMTIVMVFTATAVDVSAQNLQAQLSNGNTAYQKGDFEGCRNIYDHITKTFGARAPMLYGPKFGVIYYRKGLCELKLAGEAKRGNRQADASKWFE